MADQQLLNQINDFYNSAWDKLILVGVIALTIVGIITPAIIQWYQKQTLKLNEEKLRENLRKEIEISKNQLKLEIEETVNHKLKKVNKKLTVKNKILYNNSEGGLSFLEGNNHLDGKYYFNAIISYSVSMNHYRKAENFLAIQRILSNFIECLSKIRKSDFIELKKNYDTDIDDVLTKILNADKYGVTRNLIIENIYEKYDFLKAVELRKD